MINRSIKWPMPTLLAVTTLAATFALASHARLVDLFLNSFTGLFATLGALLATGRLAVGPLSPKGRLLWQLIAAIFSLIAVGEFVEPISEDAEQHLGIDNVDDLLLLAVAPIALWLTAKLEPMPIWARPSLVVGFVLQIGATALDLLDDAPIPGLNVSPARVGSYADFAQFLSIQCYLLAVFLTFIEIKWRQSQLVRGSAFGSDLSAYFAPLRRMASGVISHRTLHTLMPPPIVRQRFWTACPGQVEYLHGIAVRAAWQVANPFERALYVLAIALWPVASVVLALWATNRAGRRVRVTSGKSLPHQAREQITLSLSHGIPPKWYYVFELWRDELRSRAGEYLLRAETKDYLFKIARDRSKRRPTRMPFQSKYRLINRCMEGGVRAVPYHGALRRGEFLVQKATLEEMFSGDLFVKPLVEKGGRGAECWIFRRGSFENARGRVLSRNELLSHLRRRSLKQELIIQPRVVNHRALRGLALNALCTVRVLTCENEREEVEVTDAVLRMPRKYSAIVDNFHAGGFAAAVDVSTGRLGRATDVGTNPDSRWHLVHPGTGARIEGRVLPFWQEALHLARRAHRAVSDREMVGWDIAILEDGPAIIEANGAPDLDILQRTQLRPIGNARLGRIMAWRLSQVFSGPAPRVEGVPAGVEGNIDDGTTSRA